EGRAESGGQAMIQLALIIVASIALVVFAAAVTGWLVHREPSGRHATRSDRDGLTVDLPCFQPDPRLALENHHEDLPGPAQAAPMSPAQATSNGSRAGEPGPNQRQGNWTPHNVAEPELDETWPEDDDQTVAWVHDMTERMHLEPGPHAWATGPVGSW